jgi:E3 ubiquitin-protein ligase RNF115/126
LFSFSDGHPKCHGDFLEEVTIPAPTFILLPFSFPYFVLLRLPDVATTAAR